MKTIDLCLSPDLIHLFDLNGKIIVVVDVLRATSCMTAGIAHGIASIVPFASADRCRNMKNQGYVIAGERNGQTIEGFDIGNSPYDYMSDELKGKNVAMTTTNGTTAIEKSKTAEKVIIGSFLNLSAVANHLKKQDRDVLIVCAGWKGKINMEDTLFAGALVEKLQNDFANVCDACIIAQSSYQNIKDKLSLVIQSSSHAKRLKEFDINNDIEFCLTIDKYDVVPSLENNKIVGMVPV